MLATWAVGCRVSDWGSSPFFTRSYLLNTPINHNLRREGEPLPYSQATIYIVGAIHESPVPDKSKFQSDAHGALLRSFQVIFYRIIAIFLTIRLLTNKVNFRKSNLWFDFRSFKSSMPTVVLVRKGGVGVSKPIIHSWMIENLRTTTANQTIKSFLVLFLEKEHYPNPNYLPNTNYLPTSQHQTNLYF